MNQSETEQLSRLAARTDAWWNGELDDLLFGVQFIHPEIVRYPVPTQANINDFSRSSDEICDAIVGYDACIRKEGDAFRYFNLDCFGPGVLAAFLGAEVENSSGNVWFRSSGEGSVRDLDFRVDRNNRYYRRVEEIIDGVYARTNGELIVGMPDLGGIIDVFQTFRPGEEMFYDMEDEPEAVKAALDRLAHCWQDVFDTWNRKYARQVGYSDWSRIYSRIPAYVIQADACYMFGPEHFRSFVLPQLRFQTEHIKRTVYHLDGVGELTHLDDLLALPELNAIQWIPGGSYGVTGWKDVYRRILDGGKRLQISYCTIEEVEEVLSEIGTSKNVCAMTQAYDIREYDRVMKRMEAIRKG